MGDVDSWYMMSIAGRFGDGSYCHVMSHWDGRNKINTIPRVWINSIKPSKNDR